jgi:hypothetical protein
LGQDRLRKGWPYLACPRKGLKNESCFRSCLAGKECLLISLQSAYGTVASEEPAFTSLHGYKEKHGTDSSAVDYIMSHNLRAVSVCSKGCFQHNGVWAFHD